MSVSIGKLRIERRKMTMFSVVGREPEKKYRKVNSWSQH